MADRNANIVIGIRGDANASVEQLTRAFAAMQTRLVSTGASLQQVEQRTLSHAQALARLSVASGNAAQGERILSAALSQVDRESIAAVRAQTQLVNIQQRAKGGVTGLTGALGDLKSAVGTIGIGLGAQQVAAFGVESAKAALTLRETKNALRAVAGDTSRYEEVLRTARDQQILFGGSLQENIEGLSGLTITARQSGASLQQLVDLSQRLNVLSPEQGVGGARVALAEALSGNISSLSRRFEIPKSALKGLADETKSTADRLKVLDEFLGSVGVTSAAVAGKVDQDAKAFRELAAAGESIKLALGEGLVGTLGPVARDLANIANAIIELRSQTGQGATEFDRLKGIAESSLTPTGQLRNTFAGISIILQQQAGHMDEARAGMLRLAGAEQLTTEFAKAHALTMDDERRAVAQAGAAAAEASIAEQRHGEQLAGVADKAAVVARLIEQSAQQSLIDAEAKRGQAAQIQIVQQQAQLAADAFLRLHPNIDATGVAALAAAGKLDPFLAQLIQGQLKADAFTGALERLNRASAGAAGFAPPSNALPGTRLRGADAQTPADRLGGGARQGLTNTLQKQRDLQQAQFQLELAQARTAQQRIAILQREQAATTDQAEKLRIQAQIEGERNSGARSHTSELGKQLTLNERIRDSLESQLKAQLDAAELAIRDRQARRKEDQELRIAQNALQNAKDPRFRAAAADAIALIDVERQQRALALQEKLATAGGSIVGGRVFQSIPTGRPGQVVVGPAVGGVPTPGGAAGLPIVDVRVFLDSTEIAARTITTLRTGLQSANAGGAGRGG